MKMTIFLLLYIFSVTTWAQIICAKNDSSNWQPFSINENIFVGKTAHGMLTEAECLKVISVVSEKVACNFSGIGSNTLTVKTVNNYQAYITSDGQSNLLTSITFLSLAHCHKFIKPYIDNLMTSRAVTSYSVAKLSMPFIETQNNIGYTLGHCEDSNFNNHLVKIGTKYKEYNCIPDTLYSWGDFGKATWFRENYSSNENWKKKLSRELYLSQSPLGTFGYGQIPLRFKLKEKVQVILRTQKDKRFYCSDLSEKEKKNTLIINQWKNHSGTGLDYVLCSLGPVESWSFGTKEHYDEIIREFKWIETHSDSEYELYYKMNGKDTVWDLLIDGNEFSKDLFYNNLQIFRELIDNGQGGIFYSNTISNANKFHFKTNKPIYFNPD